MVVTPSGVAPDELAPESMVFVDENGVPDSSELKPSSEFLMHHHILRSRQDANAITHCHSRHATILACCGRAIEPLHYMILVAHTTRIEVAPYATFGTAALADAVVATMGKGSACLMAK
jgi:L-fuculose-phosphate aldolase